MKYAIIKKILHTLDWEKEGEKEHFWWSVNKKYTKYMYQSLDCTMKRRTHKHEDFYQG